MAKIIKIENDIILIGTDIGTIKEVRRQDINFIPQIGVEVEIYETESNIIINKKETKESLTSGININVNNTQGTQPIYNNSNTKAVNKVIYCLLAFFLGGIGIHKFYSGKVGAGILYVVFSWTLIPGFIFFIEFLVALFKKADQNGNVLV